MVGKAHLLLSPAGPMLLMDQQLTLYLDQMELTTSLSLSKYNGIPRAIYQGGSSSFPHDSISYYSTNFTIQLFEKGS